MRIKFGDFDIEDSHSCHFNYLRIYNGIGVSRTEIGRKFSCICTCNTSVPCVLKLKHYLPFNIE